MPDLLFEIGCEEMPARFVAPAIAQLRDLAAARLAQEGLLEEGARLATHGTPRRLALLVDRVRAVQPDREEVVLGPPVKNAYDAAGNPSKAALGFAKSQGVAVGALQTIPADKGDRLGVVRKLPGRPAAEVLGELLPGLVEGLVFPKTMRWGSLSFRFARPIHWFLARLGGQVVPFTLAGIPSGGVSRGHRFLAPQEIELTSADEYLAKLKVAFVLADRDERKAEVARQVAAAAVQAGGHLVPDERLIEENTDLVEWVVASAGRFDPEFLAVPRSVIVNAMRSHQRYFALEDQAGGLLPAFVAVNNTQPRDLSVVTQGHQRVLRARLSDARYFLDNDLKRPLADRLADLGRVTYHAKLGTSLEKVERVAALAAGLAEGLCPAELDRVTRAARLAKCDLVTEMVGEFPDLQGVVGAEYARRQGEDPVVAAAIGEHYQPLGAGAELPAGLVGAVVGLADRLDTICGLFGVGQTPTGAADPYALRRAAIAVLRVVTEKGLPFSLDAALDRTLAGLGAKLTLPAAEVKAAVREFFAARFQGLLAEEGVPTDVAQAVLAAGLDDLAADRARALALAAVKDSPEFKPLAAGMKRVMNLLRKEAAQVPAAPPRPELLAEAAERELHAAHQALLAEARAHFAQKDFAGFLASVAALKAPIDRFFDDVMVMVEDKDLRENRLALLNQIAALFGQLARFNLLQLA